jgi:precorrin-3B synthase
MSGVVIKGWCPGAWQPMRSGDGLVVRIRPRRGRIDAKQATAIAGLAAQYGNGLIDLTNRGNLQIRGVDEDDHSQLVEGFAQLGLLDADHEAEARRNVLVTPFWTADDDVVAISDELELQLANGPAGLPAKFGFAVDCGTERLLALASADVRIERDIGGQLMVRAEGAKSGRNVTRAEAVPIAIDLAKWFIASDGASAGRGRMAAHLASGAKPPASLSGDALPAPTLATPNPGLMPCGALFAIAFGQITHTTLQWLARNASGLRMTPWRMMLAEGLQAIPACEGLVTRAEDPLLRVVACSGAPRCPQAHAETRALAAELAPHIAPDTRLHVSGCAKGCAQSGPSSITLVATNSGFDLIRDGSVRDAPVVRGLGRGAILANLSFLSEAR